MVGADRTWREEGGREGGREREGGRVMVVVVVVVVVHLNIWTAKFM